MKYVSCSCGYVASAETGDELLTAVEAHIAAIHRPDPTALGEPAAGAHRCRRSPRAVRLAA